ncbi:tail sheath stabilizer [Vibrio phage K469]
MSLFKKHYYHKTTRSYGAVLMAIFSDLKVDTEGKLVEIPITPLTGIRDKSDGQSPTNGVYPRGTLGFESYVTDDERQLNNNQHRLRNEDMDKSQLMRVPMGYQFKVSYRFKKADEAYQVVEQVVPAFQPSLDFKWKDNNDLSNTQNVKVKLDSFEIEDNWEGSGDEPDYHDVTFIVTMSGYMYRRTTTGSDEIKHVVIDLATFPETLSDIPVDMTDKSHNWVVQPEST